MDIDSYNNVLYALRKRVVKKDKQEPLQILLANFVGTEQQKDIEQRTSLIEDYFRVKINVKAFDDEERAKKGLAPFDFSDNNEFFNAMKKEFDMPYWALNSFCSIYPILEGNKAIKEFNNTFVYQLKACNLKCPWCYVDDINKDASQGNNARFFSISEILDVFEKQRADERKKGKYLNNLRPSGGEPTLAVEQWLELLDRIEENYLEVFVQGDTNLTTGHFIEQLEASGEIEKNLLEQVGEYNNFGLLSSFKGNDEKSFCRASGLPEKFSFLHEEQFYTFRKIVKAGIDAYPFIYDAEPETLEAFMEKGARNFGDEFYLKTWVFPLKLYGPDKKRLEEKGVNPEEYQKTLDENFTKSKEIMQNLVQQKFGLDYQELPRTEVALRVKD